MSFELFAHGFKGLWAINNKSYLFNKDVLRINKTAWDQVNLLYLDALKIYWAGRKNQKLNI